MEIDALNRMLQDIRENDDFRRRERSIDIPGIYENQGGMGNVSNFGIGGGFNFTGIPSGGGRGFVIQEPQLGPDEFGSYSIPVSDPTYRSGFDYARSIAGGMPMSQVIAPGVSYSPEQPMGYTQEQLNTAVGTTPVEPPQKLPGPGEEGYGQGIGGVTIFDDVFDKKRMPPRDTRDIMPPSRNIYGGPIPLPTFGDISDIDIDAISKKLLESGADFTNLFGMSKQAEDLLVDQ